ncbi:hypothetical protein DPMN_103931 [Dreissena polymorpha]|uniref:Uncharacterized protein n=1 Tax=Dreissena polymorpha TaxID=45954 RepID=A0A9D4HAN6_DREPO|nr:hypothetical protein DPMN_103931 [Dreissena polymorpha]
MDFMDIPGDPKNPVSVPVIRIIQVKRRNMADKDSILPAGVTDIETLLSNPTFGRNPYSMHRFPVPIRGDRVPLRHQLPKEHGGSSAFLDVRPVSGSRSDVHVDMPGQHENLSPYQVVKRNGSGRNINGPPQSDRDIHFNISGRHGNDSQHPVVHREAVAPRAPLGSPEHRWVLLVE